jgi:two-component system nitrate/nitrite response regulator NarL
MNCLVVDDHPLFRDSVVQMLRTLLAGAELRDAANAETGLRIGSGWADAILLDLTLPGMSGAEAVAAFRRACPDAKLFVLTASEDHRDVQATLRAGADAYFSKAMSPDQLGQAVLRAIDGECVVASAGRKGVSSLPVEFSPRQREILELLCQGLSNKEIALRLGIADTTVKTHVSAIFIGLGVVNRTQAVLAARRFGLLPATD